MGAWLKVVMCKSGWGKSRGKQKLQTKYYSKYLLCSVAQHFFSCLKEFAKSLVNTTSNTSKDSTEN